jgi:hypothetical protein
MTTPSRQIPAEQGESLPASIPALERSPAAEPDSSALASGRRAARRPIRGSKLVRTETILAGTFVLAGIGLATLAAMVFWFDAGRMIDLTDEGASLLHARPHDANEIVPSPFGRVTATIFTLVRGNLSLFRMAGFLVPSAVTAVLILLLIKPPTRGRFAVAFAGGIAAGAMHYAEYLRTLAYNWLIGVALGLVAIGFVLAFAPPSRVVAWQAWRRDLLSGSVLGLGLALTVTARIHSGIAATLIVALMWLLSSYRGSLGRAAVRQLLLRTLRVGAAATMTGAVWAFFALVLPAGGIGGLLRDARNTVDVMNAGSWGGTSSGGAGHYLRDVRDLLEAIVRKLGAQAPGAVLGLFIAVAILVAFVGLSKRASSASGAPPDHPSRSTICALTTGVALVGALVWGLARGELHAGYSSTEDLGPTFFALVTWAVFGRLAGVAAASYLSRRDVRSGRMITTATSEASESSVDPSQPARPGWITLTAMLLGLAVTTGIGSSNPMAFQLHFGSTVLVAALACVMGVWNGERGAIARRARGDDGARRRAPRRGTATQLLVAFVCLVLGAFAFRWILDGRSEPYRQLPLSTSTASFRSRSTGVTVDLPPDQGRGLESLEFQARRAGWRTGTPLLDITPFHPLVTFWLDGDPPFSVFGAPYPPFVTKTALLTISREREDNLRRAWLLVGSPLVPEIDYSAIASALGRPWPCGYEPVARATVGSNAIPSSATITLLRPVPGPVPARCPDTEPAGP